MAKYNTTEILEAHEDDPEARQLLGNLGNSPKLDNADATMDGYINKQESLSVTNTNTYSNTDTLTKADNVTLPPHAPKSKKVDAPPPLVDTSFDHLVDIVDTPIVKKMPPRLTLIYILIRIR